MATWHRSKYPGVRYREHPTRKHGLKPDRYITIFYKLDGKMMQETIGWASKGHSEKQAATILTELQENQRLGKAFRTLKERRALAEAEREEKARQDLLAAKEKLAFGTLFEDSFLPSSKASKKNSGSWQREDGLYRLWIKPVIGHKPLKEIAPIHLQRIKAEMAKAGRAPRSIHYAMAVVRQVFNFAKTHGLYEGENPVSRVKTPVGDNRRWRFLTHEEAAGLLAELAARSTDVHDMALLSLHTGMRAGEVFSLTWGDVDFARDMLTLRDTKNGKTRAAFMTSAVKEMLEGREKGAPADLVFPGGKRSKGEEDVPGGKKIVQISDSFNRAVVKLGLNDGVKDRRQRVTFHTLRHTFASWLVENGTDLYAVKELLGHSDFKMTARYSHLGENTLQAAVRRLDNVLAAKNGKITNIAKQK